jgi:hypothetical protein
MKKDTERNGTGFPVAGLTDADVMAAMKSLSSYIDITPGDLRSSTVSPSGSPRNGSPVR